MIGNRDQSFDDYMMMLRRRRWMILIPALAGPLLAVAIAIFLHPKYTSTSMVLVVEPKVPETYVPSVVSDDLTARLATMEEQILSRTRLQPLIERYGLYKSEVGHSAMEDLVDEMRKNVDVEPVEFSKQASAAPSQPSKSLPGFSISFTADTAKVAQQVCADLTSMFVEENLRQRERRAVGTTDFLQSQLDDAKRKLDDEDAQLAAFKSKNFGSLPDQEKGNIQILSTLTAQLQATRDALNRAQQDKTFQSQLLADQEAAWKAAQSPDSPETLQDQLKKLQDYLVVLQGRYTDDYPDVIKTKSDIAALQKQIAAQASTAKTAKTATTSSTTAAASATPSAILNMKARLNAINESIKSLSADEKRLTNQISLYQGRLQMSPGVEEQYKNITRDYQTALDFYNSLLAKKQSSQMSTSLEERQEGEQFQVLDPASLPDSPSFPNYWIFSGAGLAVGLGIGVLMAFLGEVRDKAMRDERDVDYYLGLPTLAMVPQLANGKKKGIFGRKANKQPLIGAGAKA
jgi:polysaccharide chain length determinant protein (PEP-CTERM system associated)